jgi:hypothetical protein
MEFNFTFARFTPVVFSSLTVAKTLVIQFGETATRDKAAALSKEFLAQHKLSNVTCFVFSQQSSDAGNNTTEDTDESSVEKASKWAIIFVSASTMYLVSKRYVKQINIKI